MTDVQKFRSHLWRRLKHAVRHQDWHSVAHIIRMFWKVRGA